MPEAGMCTSPRRLGQRLVERGCVALSQVEMGLQDQRRTGALLGETLVHLGLLTPRDLAETLAEQGGVPFLDLEAEDVEPEVAALVPEALARRLAVLPLERRGSELLLAMANVFDVEALAEVERHTRLRVTVVGATEEAIQAGVARAHATGGAMEATLEAAIRLAEADRGGLEAEPPIVRLVDQLLLKALRDRATDIHIQPAERTVLTRFRVDGALVQGPSLPKALQSPVLARLKILAGVDIAEARLPQDGNFRVPLGRRPYDIRASFLPALHGEKAVLRLLDATPLARGLDSLGMPGALQEDFEGLLDRPHGVILVTGPTGSGKTTTLYAALQRLNRSERCILTVEDPVEYQLPFVTQVAVNPRAGLTFASGLRAILRQDPDVILVGEIRDPETAGITLRAAMTGHLVLSTLHANDPAGAFPRLRELGLSPLDLAAALLGVHAQRLVRLNCTACLGPYEPEARARARFPEPGPTGGWQRGAGCAACGFTGVRGRRAIHELLVVTPALREQLVAGAPSWEIEALARRLGMGSLRDQAASLARQGLIPLEEAARVTWGEA